MILHEAIFKLNPNIVTIVGDIAYDAANKEVQYDMAAALAKLAELEITEDTKKQASLDKLAKLGLTPDDLKAILG